MKARLPKAYRKRTTREREQDTQEFSKRIVQHVCKGFIVVLYKKYGWRKKRCYELLSAVVEYLNNDYDEAEAEEILKQLDLPAFSSTSDDE